MSLLSVLADAKTRKSVSHGILTAVLYLSPHRLVSQKSLCPWSTPECRRVCLYTSGRGVMAVVQTARERRTRTLLDDPATFHSGLDREIRAFIKRARKRGLTPAIRLNGTSDLDWSETIRAHPTVQFYDYTKDARRMEQYLTGNLPANYHVTWSRSERRGGNVDALSYLTRGATVAVVFAVRPGAKLPESFLGHPVVDGDVHDAAFHHTPGTVLGLRAKGAARHLAPRPDGFVVSVYTCSCGGQERTDKRPCADCQREADARREDTP